MKIIIFHFIRAMALLPLAFVHSNFFNNRLGDFYFICFGLFYSLYIQSIGSGIGILEVLFHVFLLTILFSLIVINCWYIYVIGINIYFYRKFICYFNHFMVNFKMILSDLYIVFKNYIIVGFVFSV